MKLKCIFATFFAKECFIQSRDKRHFFMSFLLVSIVKIQAVGSLVGCYSWLIVVLWRE